MKKTYKDFNKIYIGESDRAELTLRFYDFEKKATGFQTLHFGGDDMYRAYFVQDEEVDIPDYYQLVFESKTPWLDIIDDRGILTFNCLENIKIYRAGDFGCIIVLSHLK